MNFVPEGVQCVEVRIHYQVDIAALAAAAAGRSAKGHVFFAPESDNAVAAVAAFYIDFSFVKKHFHLRVKEYTQLGLLSRRGGRDIIWDALIL